MYGKSKDWYYEVDAFYWTTISEKEGKAITVNAVAKLTQLEFYFVSFNCFILLVYQKRKARQQQ